MKRCSTCNRTYTDPNLRFCIDDGTPLTDVEPENDDATVVTPHKQDDSWNAVGYQPPRPYVPPGGQTKRRRVWPWLVGIAGAFIVGIFVIAIAAALMVPRLARQAHEAEINANRRAENSNTAPPETNANINANTNTNINANTNTNTNTNENVEAAPPTDHDHVLTQLKDIENEWTVANLNADKKKLDFILADDFVAKDNQGELQSKADYLRTIERDTHVDKW